MSFFKNWLGKDAVDMVSNASTIGLHMVSGTFVGLAMGYYLDKWLVWTKPWLTMGFLLLGIVAGFKNVWVDVKRMQRLQDAMGGPKAQEAESIPGRPDDQGRRDHLPPPPPLGTDGGTKGTRPGGGPQGGQDPDDR
jgi:ATP synthase protein I